VNLDDKTEALRYELVKFDAAGTRQWVFTEPWSGTVYLSSIVPDDAGGIFWLGTARACSGCYETCPADLRLLKVDATGTRASGFGSGGIKTDDWGASEDYVSWATVDALGNVLVGGWSRTYAPASCFAPDTSVLKLARYSGATGARLTFTEVWDELANSGGTSLLGPDAAGNWGFLKVTATPTGTEMVNISYEISKYLPAGSLAWTATKDMRDTRYYQSAGGRMDAGGNVFVVLNSYTTTGSGATEALSGTFSLLKYAKADGAVAWTVPYDGPAVNFAYGDMADEGGSLSVIAVARPSGTCADCDALDDVRTVRYLPADAIQVTPAPEDPNNKEPQLTAASSAGALNPEKGQDIVVRIRPTTPGTDGVAAVVYAADGRAVRTTLTILP
ncbi:MAG: hypothetical protein AAB368_11540, partial [bacterium]